MSFYFCHLSDTHIEADIRAMQHGINPYESLKRIVKQICGLNPPPAFVIFTGDLINDDEPQSYHNFKRLIDRLPMPTYFSLGNHDLRQPFRHTILGKETFVGESYGYTPADASRPFECHGVNHINVDKEDTTCDTKYYYTFEVSGYRFIVLDSLVEGKVAGALGRVQLAWLQRTLTAEPQQPTVVFVHHPPVTTGIDWLDLHILADSHALVDLLSTHGQVRRVFFGHVHMPLQITVRGIHYTSVPSTCYQFGDDVTMPKRLPGPPAYGLVQVQGDQVRSRVVML